MVTGLKQQNKQCGGNTQPSLAEIAVWFHHTAYFIAPVTTGQHLYMQFVLVHFSSLFKNFYRVVVKQETKRNSRPDRMYIIMFVVVNFH